MDMRNKWFVVGILVPAVALTYATIACVMADTPLFGLVPAVLAAGLYVAAWKVGKAASFTTQRVVHADHEVGTSQAVTRWNQDRADRASATAANAAAAEHATQSPSSAKPGPTAKT
jgi:hypothetical protein